MKTLFGIMQGTSVATMLTVLCHITVSSRSSTGMLLRLASNCPSYRIRESRIIKQHDECPTVVSSSKRSSDECVIWSKELKSRRIAFRILAGIGNAGLLISQWKASTALADDKDSTVWISGKFPRIQGRKARDPNDTRGTKKDPSFLRSIADCKVQRVKEHCIGGAL